jgi:biopolymer transport protein ExbB/TolQ
MDFLNNIYILDILHSAMQILIIPTVLLIFVFILFTIYSIGTIIVESVSERRHYQVALPNLIADLDNAPFEELPAIIDKSGLLLSQRMRLLKMVAYMYLPDDARTEVARRLLYDQNQAYQKTISKTDILSKIAPMLGLMGTLIPLGPGIVALGSGDPATLSQSLLVAFDSTIAGLVTASVCFVISRVRRRWYADYLASLEGALNVLLEKAQLLQAEGYKFPKLTDEDFPPYASQDSSIPIADGETA